MAELPYLKECFFAHWDGLIWKERPDRHFKDGKRFSAATNARRWNARYAGTAPGHTDKNGRVRVLLDGKMLLLPRLVFALWVGRWPEGDVDHIDGDVTNNNPSNLRDVPHADNQRNRRKPTHNTSGVMGVSFNKQRGNWRARVSMDGKEHHVGFFASPDDAVSALRTKREQLGFHANHGER
jgi:hypothetical protein